MRYMTGDCYNNKPIKIGIFGTPGSCNDIAISDLARKLYQKGLELIVTEKHYCLPKQYEYRNYRHLKTDTVHNNTCTSKLYDIIFDEKEMGEYDLAVYMEIDPSVVSNNLQLSDDHDCNNSMMPVEIRLWQLFELNNIQRLCNDISIPLFYIYDYENTETELDTVLSHYLKHNRV